MIEVFILILAGGVFAALARQKKADVLVWVITGIGSYIVGVVIFWYGVLPYCINWLSHDTTPKHLFVKMILLNLCFGITACAIAYKILKRVSANEKKVTFNDEKELE
ncbi:MAG TPA: hypothetical protein VK177_02870 [Flavobacteriales bacterium]|nr:hypothetical protein [Flavobacteriales bacterium]